MCSISAATECYDDADIELGNSLPLVYSNADLYDGTVISLTVSYSTTTCFSNASLTTQCENDSIYREGSIEGEKRECWQKN